MLGLGSLLALAVAAVFVYQLSRWLHRRNKARRSLTWPTTCASVLSMRIEKRAHSESRFEYVLGLRFGYKAPSSIVSEYGEFKTRFRSFEEAEHMRALFERSPLVIRYNPANPGDYFVDPYRDAREIE